MALSAIFLAYPMVSKTLFQGFSCRGLDVDESWLEVDYQISCESEQHLLFIFLGVIGVCIYPIGTPTITLVVLLKNRGDIRDRGLAVDRYQFLIADYKEDFFYWGCLEMLRKVCITGLIIFVSRGSLLQLVVTLLLCICFLAASAWYQPYQSKTANVFKVGIESALCFTLCLAILLRVDLSKEDVGEAFVGVMMLLSNTVMPGAALAIGLLGHGFEVHGASLERVDEKFDVTENPLEIEEDSEYMDEEAATVEQAEAEPEED